MRIIFVRHGHPNYQLDCLTELGHRQAEAVAERLGDECIDAFFSSSCGRAKETCEHIAAHHEGASIKLLDFMREISWGAKEEGTKIPEGGHPWHISTGMVREGKGLMDHTWYNKYPFSESKIVNACDSVSRAFDAWLSELGFTREGEYYRVGVPRYKTVVLTSHAGSSSAVISHIFNLPMPFVCHAISPHFTAVTVVSFDEEEGALVSPRFEIANDARHIAGIEAKNIISN